MLILSRKRQEAVVISGTSGFGQVLKVTVLEVRGGNVKLGFEAADEVPIHRAEVWERIRAKGRPPEPEPIASNPKYRVPYID